jgi:hypothetical protein
MEADSTALAVNSDVTRAIRGMGLMVSPWFGLQQLREMGGKLR